MQCNHIISTTASPDTEDKDAHAACYISSFLDWRFFQYGAFISALLVGYLMSI